MMKNRRTFMHRSLMQLVGAGSVAVLQAKPSAAATPDAAPTLGPLISAGLDPFSVYCRMFSSTINGAQCAWWFMGALPLQVQDIGAVDTMQEETIRTHRSEVVSSDQINILWREVGIFRDITTGAIPKQWLNPITGESRPQNSSLRGGPSRHVIRKVGEGVSISLEAANIASMKITLDAVISDDRVCLTHVEEKKRNNPSGQPSTLRTVFKIYSSLAELRGDSASVSARGFYGVRNMDTGNIFVNGLMQKAGMAEKVNLLAWERAQTIYPDFFDGTHISSNWQMK